MTIFSRLFLLSATVLSVSGGAHAQGVDVTVRDTVTLNRNGYAAVEKTPIEGDADFAMKAKVVRDAFKKREIRKQQDKNRLPALSSLGN